MSGVVLRCPTCGTTQGTPGECEACSEGTVRYFCDNHDPGLWLDGPVCKGCGASVGRAAAKVAERKPVTTARPEHRTRRPDPVRTRAPRRREPAPADARRPPRDLELEDAAGPPSLSDLLAHLSAGRDRAPLDVEELPARPVERELPGRAPFLGGCLLRLLLLVLLLIVLAVAGFAVLLGGLFQ